MPINLNFCTKKEARLHKLGVIFYNEGDPPKTGETTGEAIQAYTKGLPRLLQTSAPALNQFMSTVAPAQQALQARLFEQYAPMLNSIGQQMANSNAASQAASDANILKTSGQDVIRSATAAQQIADPQFFHLREQIGQGVSNILSGLGNPNALSGSESANIERNLNRSNYNAGNAFVGSPLTTIQNAMTFGNGLQQRQGFNMGMQQAAAGIAPQLKSGVDTFQMVTGRPSIPQFGSNQMTSAADASNSGNSLANSMLGGVFSVGQNAASLQQARNQNNSVQGIMSSLPSYS